MAPKRKPPAQRARQQPEQEQNKRARPGPKRTPQTPFEIAQEQDDDPVEPTYSVDCIKALRFVKGERQYLVSWQGYSAVHDTWEPMEHLVGCADEIRAYERAREAQDAADKQALVENRDKARQAAEAQRAALRKAAAEAAARTCDGNGGTDSTASDTVEIEGADDEAGVLKEHKGKRGSVWTSFDLTQHKPSCKLLLPAGGVCGAVPSPAGGTTNYWSHLFNHHKQVWLELKQSDGTLGEAGKAELGNLKAQLEKMTADSTMSHTKGGEFLSAKLSASAKSTLDRVTTTWIVDNDQPFNAASTAPFRHMMSVATNGKYDGCCEKTVKQHLAVMAASAKEEVKRFHAELLQGYVKPAASGDLWSKNGTALFGIVSHGITRTVGNQVDSNGKPLPVWTMKEKLCCSLPCSKDRHTGEWIAEVSDEAWAASGIDKPVEQICTRVSDNGSNMLKGWREGFQAPCCDHTLELSVNLLTAHPRILPTLEKGRGIVGYFNSSNVGYNEEGCGLHQCQALASRPQNRLTQDVKTRWRSSHDMCNSLRINQEPLLLYEVRHQSAAAGFMSNRFSLEDWAINNEVVALLAPLANASQYLEGKSYPTMNLVLPSIYGCIKHLEIASPVRLPWDAKLVAHADLRPEVQEARIVLYDDMVQRWKTDLPSSLKRFYLTATLLDPRQKSCSFPGITAADKHEAREWLISEFISLWQDKIKSTKKPTTPVPAPDVAHPQHSGASFLDFISNLCHLANQDGDALPDDDTDAGEAVEEDKSEVDKYLELPPVPMKTDILKWWAAHEEDFPNLAGMARQYLGCPATSASAERLFSIAGRVYDDLRQAMSDNALENLTWARINKDYRMRE